MAILWLKNYDDFLTLAENGSYVFFEEIEEDLYNIYINDNGIFYGYRGIDGENLTKIENLIELE